MRVRVRGASGYGRHAHRSCGWWWGRTAFGRGGAVARGVPQSTYLYAPYPPLPTISPPICTQITNALHTLEVYHLSIKCSVLSIPPDITSFMLASPPGISPLRVLCGSSHDFGLSRHPHRKLPTRTTLPPHSCTFHIVLNTL